jgi:dimethylaniline monooxygenase (N-oxide forming)
MPLAEAQSEWVADLISGEASLPSYDEMRRQIRIYDEKVKKRYVASKRHTIQVDFHSYLVELKRERQAGKARAGTVVTRGYRRLTRGIPLGKRPQR